MHAERSPVGPWPPLQRAPRGAASAAARGPTAAQSGPPRCRCRCRGAGRRAPWTGRCPRRGSARCAGAGWQEIAAGRGWRGRRAARGWGGRWARGGAARRAAVHACNGKSICMSSSAPPAAAASRRVPQSCNKAGRKGLSGRRRAAHLTAKAAAAGRAARCLMATCVPQKAAGGRGRAGGRSGCCCGNMGRRPRAPPAARPMRRPWVAYLAAPARCRKRRPWRAAACWGRGLGVARRAPGATGERATQPQAKLQRFCGAGGRR